MKKVVEKLLKSKNKSIPIISFPVAAVIGKSVNDFVTSPDSQAEGMKYIADNYPVGAVFNMMDLSVEAEAFGARVRFEENKIPEIAGKLISDIREAETLKIPPVSEGRCPVFIEGIKLAKQQIKELPVFCGVIGPYSLACRLYGMTELMMECFDSPEEVKLLLNKCTGFITNYILALKSAGADGVLLCEPAAGLLSPDMAEEFSFDFVKTIFREISSDTFIAGYHNCGASVSQVADLLSELNADIYHFGNAINLADMIPLLPPDSIVTGNLDPMFLKNGDNAIIAAQIKKIISECGKYDNFILSTGCDVPPDTGIESIEAYFSATENQ